MTPLVSSYKEGSLDTSSTSNTQQKLNACIMSLQNMVDEWVPDETSQGYADYTLEPTLYYFGLTRNVPVLPAQEVPIICNVGSLLLNVGKIDIKGVLIMELKSELKEDISDYGYISLSTTSWEGEAKPTNSKTHVDEPYEHTEETEDGAVIKDVGTLQTWTKTTYYDVHYDYTDDVWRAQKQIHRFTITNYKRTVDLSKWNVSFTARYKRK